MINFITHLFNKDKKVDAKDRLFYIPTVKILTKEEDKKGLIIGFEFAQNSGFKEIEFGSEPKILSAKKGISTVEQSLDIEYKESTIIFNDLKILQENKSKLSLLHIRANGKALLYGEHIGLEITNLSEKHIGLRGKEEDTFYSVSSDLALTYA